MRDAFAAIAAIAAIADEYAHSHREPADAMRVSQQHLVDHFVDNLGFSRAVAALPVSKDGYLASVRAMAALIEPALSRHPEAEVRGRVDATARYIAGAAYGLIDAWLTGEIDLEPAELVERLTLLLPSCWLRRAPWSSPRSSRGAATESRCRSRRGWLGACSGG
ncbi:hypothetical protein [Agromyces aerolatus]|uniref:hypothetical protein n=1 Tax=Agromyces sp. LY-1074 TaxID=3074080 RepID=UPI00285422E7|nr:MULTISPECIES: hypothetical protein [unclassified Agromyces]MDR5700941.1 hypothetical protein [Agromyces sp. LY-1074]MDR5707398.1 hypothetical protein [Agromyces sp. LY-1358]